MAKKKMSEDLLEGIDDDSSDRGWKTQGLDEEEFTPGDDVDDPHSEEESDPRPDPKPKKKTVEDDLDEEDDPEEDEPDEEGEPDEEDEDEENEDDGKDYSKAVQKRIQREIKLKKEAEARADEANDRAYKSDLGAYEARKVTLEGMAKENQRDIADEKLRLKAAKEEDDTDAEIEAMTRISELQTKALDIKRGADSNAAPAKVTRAASGSPQATRWMDRNKWFQNPSFKNEIAFARVIDGELGGDPEWKARVGTSEYFAELDRQIHEKMPNLRMSIKKAYGAGKKTPRVTSQSRGTVIVKHKKSKNFQLSREDRVNAAEFGLTTKAELDAYAKEKYKRVNAEGGR